MIFDASVSVTSASVLDVGASVSVTSASLPDAGAFVGVKGSCVGAVSVVTKVKGLSFEIAQGRGAFGNLRAPNLSACTTRMVFLVVVMVVGGAAIVGCARDGLVSGPSNVTVSGSKDAAAGWPTASSRSAVRGTPSVKVDEQAASSGPAMEDADACLQPVGTAGGDAPAAYSTFIRRAVGFPSVSGALGAVLIGPSFQPNGMLSLHRRRAGEFVLRLTRLREDVWAAMLDEMEKQQGSTINLSDANQASALRNVSAAISTVERTVDAETARMIQTLLSALLGRAQRVEEIGVATAKLDGTSYLFWHAGKEGGTASPRSGSILGLATSAVDDLCQLVEKPSVGDRARFRRIRDEMAVAVERSLRNEPCLRPWQE